MQLRKKPFFVVVSVSLIILLFGVALARAAGTGEPGSSDDPLVTRGYVEAQLNSRLPEKVNAAVEAYAEKYIKWQVVDLAAGQRLEAKAGTELIVRAGKTLVVDPVGSGIPDVTAGVNITAGQGIALDHHLIIPRTDGRGINARSKAIVMYKGEIEIK